MLALRGEILLPKSQLEKINHERMTQGLNEFVNTRNAAA
jgi:NAD-dependent DNA ligase